jgi:hypothetical protein
MFRGLGGAAPQGRRSDNVGGGGFLHVVLRRLMRIQDLGFSWSSGRRGSVELASDGMVLALLRQSGAPCPLAHLILCGSVDPCLPRWASTVLPAVPVAGHPGGVIVSTVGQATVVWIQPSSPVRDLE